MARCAAKNFVVRVYFEIFFKQLNLNGEQKEITTCYILIEFFFFLSTNSKAPQMSFAAFCSGYVDKLRTRILRRLKSSLK